MTNTPNPNPSSSAHPVGVRGVSDGQLTGAARLWLIPAGLVSSLLIGWLDYATGPHFSCSIFYLIPVVACAWWGGFPHAALVAVVGSVVGFVVDRLEIADMHLIIGLWNCIVRFGTLSLAANLVSRLRQGFLRERLLARSDPLTGAANARTFYEITTVEVDRARRTLRPLTLAYFDIDNFKQLNDRLGHAVGDEALEHIVGVIHHNTRASDLLARLGGDEFALLLPEMAQDAALTTLVRLQTLLSDEMARKGWPVTLSVGAITFLRPEIDLDRMIQQVDALMYGAKRKGKGRVEHLVDEHRPESTLRDRCWTERRGTARLLCNRTARIHCPGTDLAAPPPGAAKTELFACIVNLSAEGVRFSLGQPLSIDTLVVIEPVAPGPRTLFARVVNVIVNDEGWQHGCQLATRLNAEELGAWLGFGEDFRAGIPEPLSNNQANAIGALTPP